ncbi:hypothetical protein MVES1_003135 [Malassezia vespertilionis]|uniref:uncharacterized protein n=1 Tax=Malassezia vespertilionis TaxID=2020962 RepID=UPI0024B0B28E|nr:uncharacterized protein MVES1_003135 [Malassezia vespertilionis]WFD07764.1 hypothetical protein MVES1_003135 [Malassezia vespertilionis]
MKRGPSVPVLDAVPSYEAFLETYLLPNRPVVLPPALVEAWPAFREWASDGVADWDTLRAKYGEHTVPVVITTPSGTQHTDMRVDKAVEQIPAIQQEGGSLYIKDWHLVRGQRGAAPTSMPYCTPYLFADDWMNNVTSQPTHDCASVPYYPDVWLATQHDAYTQDDFRFCYAGTAGSATPIHRDGRKRWRLFAPPDAHLLRRFPGRSTSETASTYAEMEAHRAHDELGQFRDGKLGWPGWEDARLRVYTVEQGPGQTIFVPSNWYHEVENVTDCISLNHNWCNAVNLVSMYNAMEQETDNVAEALVDVRDMMQDANPSAWQQDFVQVVQDVVHQDAGWAWDAFWRMVLHNLQTPPCAPSLRPPAAFVHQQVRALLTRFAARPETPWLGAPLHTHLHALQQLIGAPA